MTTAVVTFGVADLALERAQRAETHLVRKANPVLAFLAKLFAGFAARILRSAAKELVSQAVWFKGAKAQLAMELEDGKPLVSENLIAALEKLEDDILICREKMLKLLTDGEKKGLPEPIAAAISAWISAAVDLHDALVEFRWAAMEAEADADIKSGRIESDSVDEQSINRFLEGLKN